MVRRTKEKAGVRAPLTRERVVEAAVRIADRSGIQSLSMRRLGEEVGVEAMSLYNHVSNKEDVLDAMIDWVFRQAELAEDESGWKAAMQGRATRVRQLLLRHPWAIGLMESRRQPGAATLRHHNAVLGVLRKGGFSIELAAHAYSLLDSYVYGFTMNELSLPFEGSGQAAELGESMIGGLRAAYPWLAEMIREHASRPGYSYSNEFEFGLDLILDGLERALAAK